METTTETSATNRELTATEIKITLAQIEDRLARWIAAATACRDFLDSEFMPVEKELVQAFKKAEEEARSKNQIPYGVCLFPGDSIVDERDKALFLKLAKWWVKGEMNDESFDLFIFHFSEIVEIDFFWVLMDQPAFFYKSRWKDYAGEPTYAELESELKQIGTRSKKKQRIDFKLNIGHGGISK
jgi:hypothetical protein